MFLYNDAYNVLSLNNSIFGDFVDRIYPIQIRLDTAGKAM